MVYALLGVDGGGDFGGGAFDGDFADGQLVCHALLYRVVVKFFVVLTRLNSAADDDV